MESNPGTFGVSVQRIKPKVEDDTIVIKLTLGDARRLHQMELPAMPKWDKETDSLISYWIAVKAWKRVCLTLIELEYWQSEQE